MMENHPDTTLAEQYAAALDWWREAGVDCDFADDAQNWLAEPEAAEQARPDAKPAAPIVEPAPEPAIAAIHLPTDLAAFRNWWLDPESPLPGGTGPRIAPRGEAGAALLLLVPMPEADDREQLLAGPQGRLLGNIARALGHAPDAAYLASVLPCALPLPDWEMLAAEGLGAAVQRHIELAQPQRIIVFGSKLPPLLGHDPAAPPESFVEIAGIPALTTFAPERLIDHPRQRARLWHRLLEWTA